LISENHTSQLHVFHTFHQQSAPDAKLKFLSRRNANRATPEVDFILFFYPMLIDEVGKFSSTHAKRKSEAESRTTYD